MNAPDRQWFLQCYAKLLTRTWSSGRFTEQLYRDPRQALARCGLKVPDGSQMRIVDAAPSAAGLDPDSAVALWESGWTTGTFVLHVPATPQPDQAARLLAAEYPESATGLLVG